jgi:hypothetical protein
MSSPGTRVPGKPSASSVDTSSSRVRVTVVAEEARAATDRAQPARVPATTRPSSRRVGTMTSRARPEVDAFLHADVPARVDPRPIPETGPAPSVAIADIASPPRVSPRSHRSPPRARARRDRKSADTRGNLPERRIVRLRSIATVQPSGGSVLLWITAPLFEQKNLTGCQSRKSVAEAPRNLAQGCRGRAETHWRKVRRDAPVGTRRRAHARSPLAHARGRQSTVGERLPEPLPRRVPHAAPLSPLNSAEGLPEGEETFSFVPPCPPRR